ncbi:hypothetical protein RND81_06G122000 [Saponaria officinalis]|uniref:BHLH domain-containing protein n=1 Tax=Saponaria officinalis TaxID=3572 RepID=A0AAW1KB12_SAPOF
MVEELFQGGVCGGTWWNPSLFSGGGGGSSLCSVAQLGGGCDMGGFVGWTHEIMKGRFSNVQVYDDNNNNNNNNLVFSAEFDSTFDTMGFDLSPTTSIIDWNQQQHQFCKGNNEENYESLLLQDNLNSKLNYDHDHIESNIQSLINSTKFPNQDESSPTLTTSSNSPEESSTITYEDGFTINYPMNSSASYLIQSLFNDDIDNEELINPNNDFGSMDSQISNGAQLSNGDYNNATNLSDIRAAFIPKSHNCAKLTTKLKHEEIRHESKKNLNNDQPAVKRPRIETPSSMPIFKVRKEKLGDRITALQQLVSPFGKTDTASVLHEAIEYIKFLHEQVHVLSTSYSKNGPTMQHQQISDNKEELNNKQDLRNRGLCLGPISSTYPVTQETPVDFWTPKFG